MSTFPQALAACAMLLAMIPSHAMAEGPETTAELGFVMSTLLLLISGLLVIFTAAGFSMLEAGFVRVRNVAMQLTKNVSLVAGQRWPVYWYWGRSMENMTVSG